METTYYTFRANEIAVAGDGVEQVSGGEGRRVVCLRRSAPVTAPKPGKVISLDAWRAAHEEAQAAQDAQWEDEDALWADETRDISAKTAPAIRPRREHRRQAGMYLDWLASLALIAVALAACASFLL